MHRLCDEDLTDEELHRAKEFTKGRLRLDLETTNGVAFWLTYQELLLGEIKDIEDELRWSTTSPPPTCAGSRTRCCASPMQVAVIGPFSRESAFRPAIES